MSLARMSEGKPAVLIANPDVRELRRYNREPWPWCGKGHPVTRHRMTSGRSAFVCTQCWCETLFDGHMVNAPQR